MVAVKSGKNLHTKLQWKV